MKVIEYIAGILTLAFLLSLGIGVLALGAMGMGLL